MAGLLPALVAVSQKAAEVARRCRAEGPLARLPVAEKPGPERGPRFARDFKTLADVLIQELIKHDLGTQFPELRGHIHGEESSEFRDARGGTVTVRVCDTPGDTVALLLAVLGPEQTRAAELLAEAVHQEVTLGDTELDGIDPGVSPGDVGIWIDPIAMAIEGGMKCVKFLVFFFNFIFWVCGVALVAIGSYALLALGRAPLAAGGGAGWAPAALLALGVVIFFTAFFGCCGAWRESYCMVTTVRGGLPAGPPGRPRDTPGTPLRPPGTPPRGNPGTPQTPQTPLRPPGAPPDLLGHSPGHLRTPPRSPRTPPDPQDTPDPQDIPGSPPGPPGTPVSQPDVGNPPGPPNPALCAAAIAGYVFKDKVHGLVEEGLREAVRSYGEEPALSAALDAFQHEFSCCGVDNYTDWASVEPFRANDSVPSSCCRQPGPGCNVRPSPATVFSRGCLPSLEAWLRRNVLVLAAVALGIAFVEVLGVLFSCCLMRGIRSGYEVM
ncbi:CD63 antigen [Passer montanus]|uniref:CD63 antigen n=1 Tax=Passer montanus TaxID=9160 RepID=UPI001961A2BF|nr:CD63 antigen [Passer montanus]